MEQNTEPKKMTVILDHDLWRKCSMHKLDTGESIQQLIVRVLTDYFEQKK